MTLPDDVTNRVILAAHNLAVTLRDEGRDAAQHAAQQVLDAAGDPLAAVAVLSALIPTDLPVHPWWQAPPRQARPCGTQTAYARHLRRREPPCDPCKHAHAIVRLERRHRAELVRPP